MKPIHILIVDDDPDFAESLMMAVAGDVCRVNIAHTGEEAIEKYRENDFDIVFMDVKLPGKNGVECLMEIQRFKPDVRAVVMTGFSVDDLLAQALKIGVLDVFQKPLDLDKVLTIVRNLKDVGVLIADDNPDFVESIKEVLERKGYQVFIASNGREVIEKVRSRRVEVLILDLRMPVMNGLETFLELRKRGHIVPAIIATGYVEEEAEALEYLRTMSVDCVLSKPFDPEKILEFVEPAASCAGNEDGSVSR